MFRDLNNPVADALMHQGCNYPAVSGAAEDLYVGVCLAQAPFFTIIREQNYLYNPCMLTLRGGRSQFQGPDAPKVGPRFKAYFERLLRKRSYSCGPCPISAHPLKAVEHLLRARDLSLGAGCGNR